MHAGDETEFADIDSQGGIFDLVLEQAAGEIGRRKTVGLRHFADIIDGGEPATAAHVLDGDARVAGDMP